MTKKQAKATFNVKGRTWLTGPRAVPGPPQILWLDKNDPQVQALIDKWALREYRPVRWHLRQWQGLMERLAWEIEDWWESYRSDSA